jgi:hypothetical protein
LKRVIRNNLGFKAPNGIGWFTNTKKVAFNKVYNKTSRGCLVNLLYSFHLVSLPFPFLPAISKNQITQEVFMSSQQLQELGNSERVMFAEKLARIKMPSKTKTVHGIIIKQEVNTRVKEIKTNQVLFF